MKTFTKILTYLILPLCIIFLGYLLVESIIEPVHFQNDVKKREAVGIERLKQIRTLQSAYKTKYGEFTASADSLIEFYNNGELTIVKAIGSMDDSLAVAQKKVRRDSIKIAVKDTLFRNEPHFVVDSIKYIPFSGGKEIEFLAVVKMVSGVNVPLFECNMPYDYLLCQLDRQLVVNFKAEKEDLGKYPGLKVGSITSPNNNAGNWE